ncbi:malonate decarboxylase holo-[acyl-carrier-protein] synthase [Pseudomonas typographi]|uniref:Malonate decarboxylase holo-[acyl-carrier-protein] synthase n=1 Tax=Pseudomonas typographi TaxID=2715964 RepID=A0ABR7YZ26_9PSED|nr:malonate decarboxylase holo-[acyl-carrier-protein] synthase [Pseudomonas typographi]MBD1550055.1 malonate decarboxylase holo-[acyl-carrier-protein] synthase [Pseudomonas typographi]MBD1585437.1 malonate decarboxylase holo-[acyl-carrier-protein] synthase [Pseudomonas typographi]MBD1598450.1 malonate decarboxylase holo-[acyl-carrier-protein] synthase [Pseudomonas typographi]
MLSHWQGRRHTLVWVEPAAWRHLCERNPGAYPEQWAQAGRPVIVRRPLLQDPTGEVPLGLPLPPSLGKKRLVLTLPPRAIVAVQPPPLLADAQEHAPASWRTAIAEILAVAPQVRAFGSLAWSALTGLPYLSPTSDLDLLFELGADSEGLLDRLRRVGKVAAAAPMRIDGECVRQDGWAVNWQELADEAPEVLVKRFGPPLMQPRAAFLRGEAAPLAERL